MCLMERMDHEQGKRKGNKTERQSRAGVRGGRLELVKD